MKKDRAKWMRKFKSMLSVWTVSQQSIRWYQDGMEQRTIQFELGQARLQNEIDFSNDLKTQMIEIMTHLQPRPECPW